MGKQHHFRRPEAEAYRKLYLDRRWRGPSGIRKQALERDLYTCQWTGCGKLLIGVGNAPNAPVVHHRQDHKGDVELFFDLDNLMSICKACHDGPAQQTTHRGYVSGHGADGRPIDPNHPWNRQKY